MSWKYNKNCYKFIKLAKMTHIFTIYSLKISLNG